MPTLAVWALHEYLLTPPLLNLIFVYLFSSSVSDLVSTLALTKCRPPPSRSCRFCWSWPCPPPTPCPPIMLFRRFFSWPLSRSLFLSHKIARTVTFVQLQCTVVSLSYCHAVPSGYPNPTRYPVFLLIPDPTGFSFGNHRVEGNPKHRVNLKLRVLPDILGSTRKRKTIPSSGALLWDPQKGPQDAKKLQSLPF